MGLSNVRYSKYLDDGWHTSWPGQEAVLESQLASLRRDPISHCDSFLRHLLAAIVFILLCILLINGFSLYYSVWQLPDGYSNEVPMRND